MAEARTCPQCGEDLVHANLGHGAIDTYCEDCGWPDECRDSNPACVVCGEPGAGVCGEQWRCDEHWGRHEAMDDETTSAVERMLQLAERAVKGGKL